MLAAKRVGQKGGDRAFRRFELGDTLLGPARGHRRRDDGAQTTRINPKHGPAQAPEIQSRRSESANMLKVRPSSPRPSSTR